jgi:BlaI family penicillinase repressor
MRHMTLRNIGERPLTSLQQAILEFLWTEGSATSEQVREGLLPGRALKDPTVRTLLRRLEARGFLSHRTEGKVFVYRAKVPRRNVAARAVQHIIERFCAGSADQFLAGMVDEKVLTVEQIARLAKKIKGRS